MKTKQAWLKMVGTGENPFPDNWLTERPELLTEVRFTQQPTGINSGDPLLYYAAGKQRLFALARASESGTSVQYAPTPTTKRWPYRMRVQVIIAIPTMPLALPSRFSKKTAGRYSSSPTSC